VKSASQILAICNRFVQLWVTSNSLVQSWAVWNSSIDILVHLEMSG